MVDDNEWARASLREMLPMILILNGSMANLAGDIADGLGWAHSLALQKLPMTLNGPVLLHQKNCL